MASNKPRKVFKAELGQIMQLLLEAHTDKEIIRNVGLSERTYYRYKAKVLELNAKVFETKDINDLAYHINLLHDRLTIYLRTLNDHINTEGIDGEEKLEYINTAREVAQDIHDLNVQSLDLLIQKGGIRIERIDNNKEPSKELSLQE